jgi:CubicO group peptidase (beta-lactamase class C family)
MADQAHSSAAVGWVLRALNPHLRSGRPVQVDFAWFSSDEMSHLTPEQLVAREAMARDNVHISFGQGQHGGWGFGMAVRTYRGDYAPIGQFGWDGGSGTSSYADPNNQLVGLLLTQVGASTPDSTQLLHDFWTTVYQALDN